MVPREVMMMQRVSIAMQIEIEVESALHRKCKKKVFWLMVSREFIGLDGCDRPGSMVCVGVANNIRQVLRYSHR